MKRILASIILALSLVCVTACGQDASAASKAQVFQTLLSGLRFDGSTLSGGKVYFYSPGTTTAKAVYTTRAKTVQAANPYTLDSNGQATVYGDGVYDIKVTTSGGTQKAYWYNVALQDYTSVATATIDDYASLTAAVTAIGATPTRLVINSATTITGNTTVPTTLELDITKAGSINQGAYTLTINGPFSAGYYQVFTGTGLVAGLKEVIPQWYGAVVDGATDDMAAIQDAYDTIVSTGYGRIVFPPGVYHMESAAAIEGPAGAATDPTLRIGPISIEGYGATIHMDASFSPTTSSIHSIVGATIGMAQVKDVSIKGLNFTGPTVMNSATIANRYNVAEPAVSAGYGIRIQGFDGAKIEDCTFRGLKLAVVVDDKDPRSGGTIPAGDTMDSYNAIVRSNTFKNNWQSLSFTYGGLSRAIVAQNHFESGAVKLITMTDNADGIDVVNNIFKNMPALVVGTNNTNISDNKFDTVIGGIWLDHASDYPSTDYTYNRYNISINNNKFYSTAAWTSSDSNMRPVTWLYFGVTSAAVSGQAVSVKNLTVKDNTVEIWNENSSSSGMVQFNANIAQTIDNLTFVGNTLTAKNNYGVFWYVPDTYVTFTGNTDISRNRFIHESTSTNSNILLKLNSATAVSGSSTNVLNFSYNYFKCSYSDNITANIRRFGVLNINNNVLYTAVTSSQNTATFHTEGCPNIRLESNNIVRAGTTNNGIMLSYGILDSNDQSVMETLKIKSSNNIMNAAYFGIYPLNITFAAGFGTIESVNDSIIGSGTPTVWLPTIANVDAYVVCNPTRRALPTNGVSHTNALTILPVGYTVQTYLTGTGEASMYRLTSGAWKAIGALP